MLGPQVRLSYDTFWAECCSKDRLQGRALWPHVLHLRPHQLPVSTQASHRYYFSGSKSNPFSLFWNFTEHCTQQKMANTPLRLTNIGVFVSLLYSYICKHKYRSGQLTFIQLYMLALI